MKKYLFGLGAMLVGAGLMFVLMKGEVRAEAKPLKKVNKAYKIRREGSFVSGFK